MRALLEFTQSPEDWSADDALQLREGLRALKEKGVVSAPGFPRRELLSAISRSSNEATRQILSAFFQEASYTSKKIRPQLLDLVVSNARIDQELTAEAVWDKVEAISEFVDRGPRVEQYNKTLRKLIDPTERVEIVDSYLATSIVNSPQDLWLLDQLIEDFSADIELVSRPVFGVEWSQRESSNRSVVEALNKKYGGVLREGQKITFTALQPNRTADLHDRELTFFFESGFASFALGMGLKRFGYDPISAPDCHPLPREMSLSKRLARKQMGVVFSQAITRG